MTELKNIKIEDFNYQLPDESIALYPLDKRDESKLLVFKDSNISESNFKFVHDYIPENSLLIFNNTKVIRARINFKRSTGANIEIFCLEPHSPIEYQLSFVQRSECSWKCLVGNLKKWKEAFLEKEIICNGYTFTLKAELLERQTNYHIIKFSWNNQDFSFAEVLENAGIIPIPPYINRNVEDKDSSTYQTVYAKHKGSVAAPTAGLHFTENVFEKLKSKNIKTDEITLHVGAGTFKPVSSETIGEHEMHEELFEVSLQTINLLLENISNIVAVGTTSVRTIESLYWLGLKIHNGCIPTKKVFLLKQWEAYETEPILTPEQSLVSIKNWLLENKLTHIKAYTQIMIVPSYKFKYIKAIITNFHQPQSTLLLLITALVGEKWKEIYNYALNNDFRFLSYGDSSILFNRL
jgi:S-adenosylmethionine:tRNA ribosyltransferase-isomerase